MSKPSLEETTDVLLDYMRVALTYHLVACAQQQGELTGSDVELFKKHFDLIANKVADRIGDIYQRTLAV